MSIKNDHKHLLKKYLSDQAIIADIQLGLGVKISEAKMSEVIMSEVKMSEVIISEVKMSEVINIRGKNVSGLNVRGDNVRGKNVRGNIMSKVKMSEDSEN